MFDGRLLDELIAVDYVGSCLIRKVREKDFSFEPGN